ncbi:hypothetical protein HTZ77_18490 [Nonomuraea sp. SMC257]|uniref:Uncharacterized protein n=1 Tax=Nonomuraea montanisoli TaxID=2741721 RepID=A0A7Y6I7Z7_9ACTN|nr:hypothetical protein [Nonomuraea montanisoli]NUW33403.1 hypothetical protein [Nonomuraea montanisoli]
MTYIPLVLVSHGSPAECHAFHVVDSVTFETVIRRKGRLVTAAHVALVDPHPVFGKQAIIAALHLRNAGMTAIVGDPTLVPGDLVRSLHAYMAKAWADAVPIQTDVLVLEDAMHFYDDLHAIIREFESETVR